MSKTSLQVSSTALFAFSILLWCMPAFSETPAPSSPDNQRLSSYKDKPLMLREPYCGKLLKFNVEGKLEEGGQPGAWTLCGDVRITDIRTSDNEIKIEGQRIYLFYDQAKQTFRDVNEAADHTSKSFKELVKSQKVEIRIALPPAADEAAIQPGMEKTFWPPETKLSELAPDIWKPFLNHETPPGPNALPKAVKQPKVLFSPDPEYTVEARLAKFQGIVALKVLISIQGEVSSVSVSRPAGMGLDEQAAEIVKRWKFIPAQDRDGNPTPIYASIEVNFRLY